MMHPQQGSRSETSRLWIALGLAGCLAGGATATWLLADCRRAELESARAASTRDLRGTPIVLRGGGSDSARTDAPQASVSFDLLSGFYYDFGAVDRPKDQIPAPVRALDGRKVAIQGFMIPITLERGATKEFLIAKGQYCC